LRHGRLDILPDSFGHFGQPVRTGAGVSVHREAWRGMPGQRLRFLGICASVQDKRRVGDSQRVEVQLAPRRGDRNAGAPTIALEASRAFMRHKNQRVFRAFASICHGQPFHQKTRQRLESGLAVLCPFRVQVQPTAAGVQILDLQGQQLAFAQSRSQGKLIPKATALGPSRAHFVNFRQKAAYFIGGHGAPHGLGRSVERCQPFQRVIPHKPALNKPVAEGGQPFGVILKALARKWRNLGRGFGRNTFRPAVLLQFPQGSFHTRQNPRHIGQRLQPQARQPKLQVVFPLLRVLCAPVPAPTAPLRFTPSQVFRAQFRHKARSCQVPRFGAFGKPKPSFEVFFF
jgi:hypothetical protein